MKQLLLFLPFFLIKILIVNADTTTVYGTIPSYANMDLKIKYLYDPITEKYDKLASAQVDSSGNFEFKFDIQKIYYGIIDKEKLRGFIFLVPGKKYEITLPDFLPKLNEDLINPYYEPYEFYIKILNPEPYGLNKSIYEFDFGFAELLDNKYRIINMQGIRADFDSIETYFLNKAQFNQSKFLKKYIKYNIFSIKASVLSQSPEIIFQTLLSKDYADFQNPAFEDFFTQNFSNFFTHFSSNNAFTQAVNEANSQQIINIISNKNWIENEKLISLAFLKGLFDAYYEHLYSEKALITLLTNYISIQNDEQILRIAGNILYKISKLRVGNPAPDFELLGPDSLTYSLQEFRNYYVYLNFCSSNSFSCIQQYGLLFNIDEKYLDSLKIVTIAADDDFDKTYNHFVKYRYRWDLLSFKNQADILKTYEIKAYPTYFLIDPEGNLLWSPALAPNEGFAAKYYDFIRAIKIRDMKKEGDYNENYWK
ncbi:MAG: redoxin domain-containing protein [Bacteroidales bacterium]|nr:redoxin domain-containing protein [Bacteroidales bacterium]